VSEFEREHVGDAEHQVTPLELFFDLVFVSALGLVSAVCSLVVAYEAIRYREHRVRVRHPEVVA
jgi:low temperature requirement protein LtrA